MKKKSHLPASALVLAGGRGTRMGGNKLFLAQDGAPLLENLIARLAQVFCEIVLCVGHGESGRASAFLSSFAGERGIALAEDRAPDRGPIEGLRQGLAAMRTDWGFLIGCDMPTPQEAVIRQMWATTPTDADATVARLDDYPMSLHAFYRKSCLPHIDRVMIDGPRTKRGGAKLTAFYADIRLNVVEEPTLAALPGYRKSFAGFNTQQELARLTDGNG